VASRRGGASKRSGTTSISMPCVLKFLAPEALAAAIIGKGGAAIAAMRQSCGVKITLTEYGEVYPQTDGRVVTVQANTEENLNDLSKQIVAKVVEAAGAEDELKFRVLLPRSAVGGFIGKGGTNIKQLREASGAKISTGDPTGSGPGSEQLVSMQGTAEGLETVVAELTNRCSHSMANLGLLLGPQRPSEYLRPTWQELWLLAVRSSGEACRLLLPHQASKIWFAWPKVCPPTLWKTHVASP